MKHIQLFIAFLLCCVLHAQPSIDPNENLISQRLDLLKGDDFINFKAFDVNQKEIEFSTAFDGKSVLLVFSSLYCHWCTNSLPLLEQLQQNNKKKLHIVFFYVDDMLDAQADFAQKASYPWTSVWDPTRTFTEYMQYPIQATPTFYLFDAKGKFLTKREGYIENIKQQIEEDIK